MQTSVTNTVLIPYKVEVVKFKSFFYEEKHNMINFSFKINWLFMEQCALDISLQYYRSEMTIIILLKY